MTETEEEKEVVEDIPPDVPEEAKSHLGEIYQLGNHRLMVGDSTDTKQVEALMNGTEADLVVTDPPYNVAIVGGSHALSPEERLKRGGKTIANDKMSSDDFFDFLSKAFANLQMALKPGGAFYVWYASSEHINFESALLANELKSREQLIWNKNTFTFGRSDYQWKHEPCLYGWKEGAGHYFTNDRTQSTVLDDEAIDFDKLKKDEAIELLKRIFSEEVPTTIIDENRPNKADLHPTMKPIKLIARLIKNSSRPGESVLDLFGGSGSTLIACEQLDRKCFMMEYDPKYADVIIERWEAFTGEKAVKING